MIELTSSNTLVLKRKKMRLGFPLIVLFLFMTPAWFMAMWCISHPWHGYLDILICHWILSITYPFFLASAIVIYFPRKKGLILTSEGFEFYSPDFFPHKKYRWDEVTGFYLESKPRTYKFKDPLVCFDKAGCFTKKRKVVISFYYEIGSAALVDVLNEWKEKYAPNPQGVVLDPLPEPPKFVVLFSKKGQKILRWVLAIQTLIIIATITGAVVYGKLSHEKRTHTNSIKMN